jgi:hypothetical protein
MLSNDGLTLWFGTPDAPAPQGEISGTGPVSLVVGVKPVNAANFVDVHYRIDAGPLRVAPATEFRTDERRDAQYFETRLSFPSGTRRVDYCPVAHSGDIRVPRAGAERSAYSSFVVREESEPRANEVRTAEAFVPRFKPGLTLVAHITVQLKPPTIIGKTPHGFRIDYYAKSGTVIGNAFKADVLENSVDYMLVRPDGIGVLEIHATLKTDDGAMITATYGGLIEFGEDGYERMASGNWPEMPRHQVAPRLLTADKRYLWMNRTQFLGVGQVDMQSLIIKYDVFAVATEVQPGAWPKR